MRCSPQTPSQSNPPVEQSDETEGFLSSKWFADAVAGQRRRGKAVAGWFCLAVVGLLFALKPQIHSSPGLVTKDNTHTINTVGLRCRTEMCPKKVLLMVPLVSRRSGTENSWPTS